MTKPSRAEDPRGFRHLDGGLGPALPIEPQAFDRLVEQAVDGALDATHTGERQRKRWPWLALAAIVVASSAGAATATASHFLRAAARPAAPNAVPVHAVASGKKLLHARAQSSGLVESPTASSASIASQAPSSPTSSAVAPSSLVPSSVAVLVGAPTASSASIALQAPSSLMPSAVAASAVAASAIASNSTSLPAASPGEPAAVGDQLARANLMRQAGRWKDAEAAYVGIAKRFTGASEAEVASLAAATLRLEHLADPEGALRLYESVARGGRLNVEALFGVARCQRALGNQPAEQAALSKVIEQAPQSLQADRARPRLLQLQK